MKLIKILLIVILVLAAPVCIWVIYALIKFALL